MSSRRPSRAASARRSRSSDRELDLTRKEFDLLVRLARDAGRVVTRESLMSDVWDTNWFGSTKTLDVHIAWLRRKLHDDPEAPKYIHTVRGRVSARDGAQDAARHQGSSGAAGSEPARSDRWPISCRSSCSVIGLRK
jgi:hypothetical protein